VSSLRYQLTDGHANRANLSTHRIKRLRRSDPFVGNCPRLPVKLFVVDWENAAGQMPTDRFHAECANAEIAARSRDFDLSAQLVVKIDVQPRVAPARRHAASLISQISSAGREYHGRNPADLPLEATVEGFLPGFTSDLCAAMPTIPARPNTLNSLRDRPNDYDNCTVL
jgi:hypothetical protein